MARKSKKETSAAQNVPNKKWGVTSRELPKYAIDSLYQVSHLLGKDTRKRVGLTMEIPVFIQDPLVALEDPLIGVQEIEVRLEAGFGDGPTSSRIAVVDFNADTQKLTQPVLWDPDAGWFKSPSENGGGGEWLPDPPHITKSMDDSKRKKVYKEFINQVVKNPYYHQVNVWVVVQRVLEFYEDHFALGRPVPWGFDGNRLLVVPHAGYGENAFYDQNSKSLQFYYFGDTQTPGYTCLSHDIIAHETGHAILDGIRPRYNQLSSVQTGAFHEFIGDLTAILSALFNKDIRDFIVATTKGNLQDAKVLADIAEQFGEEVEERPYLRTAFNDLKMKDIQNSLSPHKISQVLTGAMFEILLGIYAKYLVKYVAKDGEDTEAEELTANPQSVTPALALAWTMNRFRQAALQPLDLCPPCDIQFIDYARAVIRNDILTNPVDDRGIRELMLQVFHQRGLCQCEYQPGNDLLENCEFQQALDVPDLDFIYHDIGRVSRSRTAAYYFLSDNRKVLHIPAHQDVQVVDLYDNNKYGAAAERLPREVVVEYLWGEQVVLKNDPEKGLDFGKWDGEYVILDCGGTLVFDDRGNLLSWFRKPGTQHLLAAEGEAIRKRFEAWQADPTNAKRPTLDELAVLDDLEVGQRRKEALSRYVASLVKRNLVGEPAAENRFGLGLQPVVAIKEGGALHFETTPHLRKTDFDSEEEQEWTANY